MDLEPLFTAELQYNPAAGVVVDTADREGDFIGNGDGRVVGRRINGTIRWSFYAADCAYLLVKAGVNPGPGQHLCRTNPGGVIETTDGAVIRFDAKGYGLRGYDPSQPHRWRLTAALQFATTDRRYLWLNTTLGVWEGEFDETGNRGHYRAYAQLGATDHELLIGAEEVAS
jgi:uncharacterized protein DUF3237